MLENVYSAKNNYLDTMQHPSNFTNATFKEALYSFPSNVHSTRTRSFKNDYVNMLDGLYMNDYEPSLGEGSMPEQERALWFYSSRHNKHHLFPYKLIKREKYY